MQIGGNDMRIGRKPDSMASAKEMPRMPRCGIAAFAMRIGRKPDSMAAKRSQVYFFIHIAGRIPRPLSETPYPAESTRPSKKTYTVRNRDEPGVLVYQMVGQLSVVHRVQSLPVVHVTAPLMFLA